MISVVVLPIYPFSRKWIFFSNSTWQNAIKALTQCSRCKQSHWLLKLMVHLLLHLSAIRCHYFSQQGQLQMVKSISLCHLGSDYFQQKTPNVVASCPHLITTVILFHSMICLFRLSPHGQCAMLSCFRLLSTEILSFIFFWTQHMTCQLMSMYQI